MSYFEIIGGKKLNGEIEVKGAKNAALKAVAAALLSREKWTITNFPVIEDTQRILEMVEDLGVKVHRTGKRVEIQADKIKTSRFDDELAKKLRASIILAGPVLARLGKVRMHHPGGCVIGKRPIDMFLDGFGKFGASVKWSNNHFELAAKKLKGAKIFFPKITVTGTETMMMTAILAEGETILSNAAMEPEIPILAEFLVRCGAKISGAGTQTIRIKKCNPDHIRAFLVYLEKAGVKFEEKKNELTVWGAKNLKPVSVATHEYPGFATDLQPPFTLLATQAKGSSLIHDSIFESRLMFTDALNLMGANIVMNDPHRVTVNGPTKLTGRKIASPDLRAGITLVLAGLIAEGKTRIENIYQIDRGYEKIEERLRKLGAEIKRVM